MISLKTRIKRIAKNMDGCAYEQEGVKVPHSVFVKWDQTWDLFEGEDERWVYDAFMDEEYSVTPNSTDEEIEEAIRSWESSHDDYYNDEINAYVKRMKGKKK